MSKTRRTSNRRAVSRILLTFGFGIILLPMPATRAQEAESPQRGFAPGNSYAVGDIETINSTNGNVILRMPLGNLPSGRGGLQAGIGLFYNSKLYDKVPVYHECPEVPNGGGYQPPTAPYPECNGDPRVKFETLNASENGGWKYGFEYGLKMDIRAYFPPENTSNYNACYDSSALFRYKLMVSFPDGSEHTLHLYGQGSDNDYYAYQFNGRAHLDCLPALSETMTYFTADGTFLRLDVQIDSDEIFSNNAWTLYFPDGRRVTGGASSQRIYDRNNNYVEVQKVTNFNGTGHPATKLVDQLGRELVIENDETNNRDLMHVPGMNNVTLTTTVKWKTITVRKTYRLGAITTSPVVLPQRVVDQIIMPQQAGSLNYTFGYNAGTENPSYGWGEISSIILPSGAQVTYQYDLDGNNGVLIADHVVKNTPKRKEMNYQREYDGATTATSEAWLYDIDTDAGTSAITAPDQGVVREWFVGMDGNWDSSLVYKTQSPDGVVVERLWQTNRPAALNFAPAIGGPGSNTYVKTEFTSIPNASGGLVQTAIKDYTYDKNGNVTRVVEYNWVPYSSISHDALGRPTAIPAGATVARETLTTFHVTTPGAADSTTNSTNAYYHPSRPPLISAGQRSELRSAAGQTVSCTEMTYDDPLTKGNLTEQRSWNSSKGGLTTPLTTANSIRAAFSYDIYGNKTLATDARGYQTEFYYGTVGSVAGLYPTQIKTAFQTSVQRTETREYDFNTGLPTRATDVDNNVSTSTTYDDLGRPILVRAAENKPEETRTATQYSDVNRWVRVSSDLNTVGDSKLVSIQHYDQLGRVRLTRQLEDAATQSATDETTGIKVQTRYLYSGVNSYQLVSNPYRAASSNLSGSEPTMGWTRTKSDNGGRAIEVQTFGGVSLPAPWGSNTASSGAVITAYDANFTTVADQAGKLRRSKTDVLGRLERVDEPDGSNNLGTNDAPVQPTIYGYDLLNNLSTVTQSNQVRTFTYDSQSRLKTATNPESGTTNYNYDDNGNLTQKIDARGVISTYTYDALNRNTSVIFTNDPAGTPAINRYYDGWRGGNFTNISNVKGRLWQTETTGTSGTRVTTNSFDALGRPSGQSWQFFVSGAFGQSFTVQRSYNLAGSVLSQTYPSGRTVNYQFDSAGRTSSFTGNLGGGVPRSYATGISYSPFGGMSQEQFGTDTPLYNKLHYNVRGQLYDVRVSTASLQSDEFNWNRGCLAFYYGGAAWGLSGTANNGNITRSQHWTPANDQMSSYSYFEDNFTYDALNRLQSVTEHTATAAQGPVAQFAQTYVYDRHGNRRINTNPAATYGGVNNLAFEIESDSPNNRIYAPGDLTLSVAQRRMQYDAAGNLKKDTYTGAGDRVYDAENHMSKAWANGQWQEYTYSADGQRVRRKMNGVETWQVYGFDSELLAEYPPNGASSSPQKEYGYRNGQLLVTAEAQSGASINVALGSNGATVSASSAYSSAPYFFPAANAINGDRKGLNSSWWTDDTSFGYPDWVQVDFASAKTLNEIDVFGLQQNHSNPVEPTLTMTTSYALTNFEVQYWTGSAWATVPGGTVTGNDKVWRKFTFASLTTSKIRVNVMNVAGDNHTQVVEVEAYSPTVGAAAINWLVADQLGTPRIIIDKTGSLANVKRHDYMPFGEELFAGQGGRTIALGYSGDAVRQKFTSQERDNETGLDYFGARYYASTQGRFTSADDFLNDTRAVDAASWNLYVYVRNTPLRYTDPTGEIISARDVTGADRDELLRRANYTYGCKDCVSVDKNGFLSVNTTGLNKDVLKATQYLTDAIRSTDPGKLFAIEVTNNNAQVAFGDSRAGSAGVQLPGNKFETGAVRIRLDFGDDKWVSGDKSAKDAFLNFVFAHEVAHFYPNYVRDPVDGRKTGPVVDAVNEIQQALGLPLRAQYGAFGRGSSGGFVSVEFGKAKTGRAGNIVHNKAGGIEVNRTNKTVTWIKRSVGGKGIN